VEEIGSQTAGSLKTALSLRHGPLNNSYVPLERGPVTPWSCCHLERYQVVFAG